MAAALVIGLVLGFPVGVLSSPSAERFNDKSIGEQIEEWTREADTIRLAADYKCCLDKPCLYCIQERECTCYDDVMAGNHPCGECIGEILEGHGRSVLAPYFAKAISHKVGEQHLDSLKGIIADIYGISVEEQV